MLSKRIIPCLDVDKGRVVKGVQFVDLIDAGDPVEVAKAYNKSLADELVFLDITASHEDRGTIVDIVKRTANSAAIKRPELINEASRKFGSQCVVVAIDAKYNSERGSWDVFSHGGRNNMTLDAIKWAVEAEKRGAGEILLTSMDKDGTKSGYDNDLTRKISESVNIPVIASGGAGTMEHFKDAIVDGKADAVLAASLFHFKEIDIKDLKEYLKSEDIPVRLV